MVQQKNKDMSIALFSINKNVYSETFIAAHKNMLAGEVFYYYGFSLNSIQLENSNLQLSNLGLKKELIRSVFKTYKKKTTAPHLLLQSLLENKIDVILVEYGTLAYSLLPLFRICDIPFIVHFHGYDASVKDVIKESDYYKEVFKRASKVIAVSKVMKTTLEEMGCPSEKLILNTYGPNDLFLKVEATKENLELLAIGRFADKKAPYLTVLAFSKVLDQFPEAKLIMAGDGPLLNTCINLVEYLGITDAVSFPGVITPDEFRNLLVTCRAFVQHSVVAKNGDMEGTPVAILEAQAAAVPVIATRHAGIPDVVVDNSTGYLVAEKDVNAMADAMFKLLKDQELAVKMGENARNNILKNFTMTRHIDDLDKALKEITIR
jgi:colanic acid/amylovoran biosynthesis glycosyltransferase